jgi:DNA-directed RNA polymerase II subunit RPB1
MWNQESYKGEAAAFSPSHRTEVKSRQTLPTAASDRATITPVPAALGHSPSSPNVYSPTSPYVPQSPFAGAMSPFSTASYVTSLFLAVLPPPDISVILPTSPHYLPQSPSFSHPAPASSSAPLYAHLTLTSTQWTSVVLRRRTLWHPQQDVYLTPLLP